MNLTLYYQYKSKCPKCKKIDYHNLQLNDWHEDVDSLITGEGNCICGYKGLVDLRYQGRIKKPYRYSINPHLIDPN